MQRRPPEVAIDPLSAAELAELQEVLDAGDGIPSVHEMNGGFAALGTGPWLVPPRAWLPAVLGPSALANLDHAQRVLELVMRSYNFVIYSLAEGLEVVPGPEASEDVIASWCFGYVDFAGRDGEWRADEVAVELLRPFAIIARQLAPEGDTRKVRGSLSRHVRELYAYWAPRRREGTLPPPRAKPARKPAARKKRR